MILVVGSTGLVGGEVTKRLTQARKEVRALVRPGGDRAKADRLRDMGAALVEGDLKDASTLRPVCAGVATVVSTASAMISRGSGDSVFTVDRDGQLALIEAAREAKVSHVIYLSFSGNIEGDFPLRDAKRAVERHLRESGLTYTIIRPSYFMEVWLGPHLGFDPLGGAVRIVGSGENPISLISAFDVAEYVARSVDNAAVHNQVIELGGPAPVTFNHAVDLFERALKRPITRNYVPESALAAMFGSAEDPVEKSRLGLALAAARGDAIDVSPALRKVPMTLTSLEDFVARTTARA